MQMNNRFFDDMSRLMTNAAGVAHGAKEEVETFVKSRFEKMVSDMDLVSREEFEAVRAMAQKAREENEALKVRLASLESQLNPTHNE